MTDQDTVCRARAVDVVRGAFARVSTADTERQLAHYTNDPVLELPLCRPVLMVEPCGLLANDWTG